jgi:hypothetical membrane protein
VAGPTTETTPATADRALARQRWGGVLWAIGVLEFVIGMIVTQELYGPPTYSVTGNYISDLGAVHCMSWSGGGAFAGDYVCSPAHDVFNIAIILLGILLIAGVFLLYRAIPGVRVRWIALGIFVVAGIGASLVGVFPEDVNLPVHIAVATTAFAGVNVALLVFAALFARDRRWGVAWGAYSLASGVVGLLALVLFLEKEYGPLGVGGMERLIVAPALLWALLVGLVLIRRPRIAEDGPRADLPTPSRSPEARS